MSITKVLNNEIQYHFETGDSLEVLQTMPDGCVNVVVCSPPYSGLRFYDNDRWEGGDPNCKHLRQNQKDALNPNEIAPKINRNTRAQARESTRVCPACGAVRVDTEIGSEDTMACWGWASGNPCGKCYTCNLVAVFDELWRVLREDGVVWLNLGESYNGYPGNATSAGSISKGAQIARQKKPGNFGLREEDLKEKDILGVPWAVAFALRNHGWFLRTDVIWAKITVLPESVGGWRWEQHRVKGPDKKKIPCTGCEKCTPNNGLVLRKGAWRPTRSHETIFQLTKSPKYFTDPLAVRQLPAEASLKRIRQPNFLLQAGGEKDAMHEDENSHRNSRMGLTNFAKNPGRNLWDVWVIPPTPLSEKHYASFPQGLPEMAIRASVSQGGYCEQCGAPYARIVERDIDYTEETGNYGKRGAKSLDLPEGSSTRRIQENYHSLRRDGRNHDNPFPVQKTLGWKATCSCDTKLPVSGIVLDVFSGSGTTVRVAKALGLRGIGIDLNPEYNKLAMRLMGKTKMIDTHPHMDDSDPNCFW